MRQEFKLQDPGEGVHEVEITEVLVSNGDEVSEGQEVLAVESDKATIELPSPYAGKVVEIRVSEGDVAEVGDVLMVIEDEGAGDETEEQPDAEEEQPEEREPETDKAEEAEAEEEEAEEEEADEEEPEEEQPEKERRPAAERKEKPAAEEEEAEEEKAKKPREARAGEEKQERRDEDERPIKAAPAARKLAKEEGVDLSEIEPTGSDGQVTLDDVRSALEKEPEGAREKAEPAEEAAERDEFGPVERVKLRSIRAATARAMARSWAEVPHVTHQDFADITELERWRRRQVKEDGDETLTLTPFIVKAAAAILRRHPRFNARLDQDSGEIVLRRYYNINVAVATERGLMTPVIPEVDRKPVRALAHELAELTERMHKGRASKQDLAGGTFTVTNVGGLGGTSFAPIINPPQTAILGCARARLMPVAVDADLEDLESARTELRLMLPLIVAFDHRVLDGADAARFVNDLADVLEDVRAFALDV